MWPSRDPDRRHITAPLIPYLPPSSPTLRPAHALLTLRLLHENPHLRQSGVFVLVVDAFALVNLAVDVGGEEAAGRGKRV